MKKGEIYEGIIDRVDYPNRGLIHIEDTDVIVKNGIPGQKVRFRINKKRNGRCEGQLLEVLEKSPLETRGKQCGIFPACGGCMYQTMSYEAQLDMKLEADRKMHEKLREHAFEEFLDEIDYEESKITDELVSYSYFNAEKEEE